MTTIAYRDGIIAADSQITSGNMKAGTQPKIAKGKNGIGGGSGNFSDSNKLRNWVSKGGDMPTFEDIDGIVVSNDGKLHYIDKAGTPVEFNAEYCAVGSGEKFAMGAMAAGATAKQAVEIACKLDTYSGGPVRSLSLPKKK